MRLGTALRAPVRFQPLLSALADPVACEQYDESRWDIVIRLARAARLLGVLAHRVEAAHISPPPERVRRHLLAGRMEARFRAQKTIHLLHTIAPLMQGHPGPWVLLKGAAYIAQGLPLAHGRLPADVDLMVRRSALERVEESLLCAGWEFEKTDAYDQHYYRAWTHELPPMRAAGQTLELDLHHSILPPIGRIRVDTERLFVDALPLPNSPFHVLSRYDQTLHAVVHLVQDCDMVGRLRDLVDIDQLFRLLPVTDAFQRRALIERAGIHGMQRPLRLAAALCRNWFDTPGSADLLAEVTDRSARRMTDATVIRLGSRVLGPPDLEAGVTGFERMAGRVLELRALWLRLPPWLLGYHAAAKCIRPLADQWEARRTAGTAE